jgi:serine/threonine-protein kinase
MATVYCATDRRLDRVVALKIMHPHLAEGTSGQAFVARFRREARAAARVTHPGLVAVYDQGVDGEVSYLTLEFVEGSDLRQLLQSKRTLTLAEALAITEDILDALAAAHRNQLVHRDVKPENVLLSKDNEVKLTDFGLARAVTEVTSTTTGTVLGTVAYLAPELVTHGVGDTRTDIYSVGIMLYEMLTGRQPFTGDSPIHIAFQHINTVVPRVSNTLAWIPEPVDDLVARFAAKDPNQRPTNASEALRELRRVQTQLKPALLAKRAMPPVPLPDELAEPIAATNAYEDLTGVETAAMPAVEAYEDLTGFETAAMPAVSGDTGELPQQVDESDDSVLYEHEDSSRNFQAVQQPHHALPPSPDEDLGALIAATSSSSSPSSPSEVSTETVPLSVRGTTIALPIGQTAYVRSGTTPEEPPSTSLMVPEEPPRRRRRGLRIVVTLLVLLGLGGASYGGWYWWENIGPGSYTVVPARIEAVPEQDALDKIRTVELEPRVFKEHHDTVPAGDVISAEPASGERVKKNSQVTLTVSLGIKEIEVPKELVGENAGAVKETLSEAGFTNVSDDLVYDTKIKKDTVMELSVKEGTVLAHNTAIVLTVSNGPEPISIPQVVSKTEKEALSILKDEELKRDVTEAFSDTVPQGTVISQDPAQGTQGHRGDKVSIVVSKGPELVAVPNVVGEDTAAAEEILGNLGFKVKINKYMGGFFGKIRLQDVEADTEIPKGSTITLTEF